MKPPGGNYKPNRMNINKIPMRAGDAAVAADTGAGADNGAGVRASDGSDKYAVGDHRTAKVMTASPMELILMMYEQFFELIPDIKQNIQRKSAAAMEPDSERAQAIVEELINALDFDVEMSKDIGAIYFYVRNLILEANLKMDAGAWDRIESVMRPLYEGFKEASAQLEPISQQPSMPSAVPSIVAGMTYGQNRLKEVVINTKSGLKV